MEKQEKKHSAGKELLDYLKMIVFVLVFVIILQNYVIINMQIPSESMEETIRTGDRVFGNRLAYLKKDPKRLDIIVFKYPDDESQLFIKRVIGLPGETVDIRDGKVYIDDSETPLDDSYIPEEMLGSWGPYVVPEDSILLWGITGTGPKIPVIGKILMSKKTKSWEKRYFAIFLELKS